MTSPAKQAGGVGKQVRLRLSLCDLALLVEVDVDHAVVAEGIDPGHLGARAKIRRYGLGVGLDLVVDGLA